MVAEFIMQYLGIPLTGEAYFYYYIVTAILGIIFIDGIIGFILSSISSIFRGRD